MQALEGQVFVFLTGVQTRQGWKWWQTKLTPPPATHTIHATGLPLWPSDTHPSKIQNAKIYLHHTIFFLWYCKLNYKKFKQFNKWKCEMFYLATKKLKWVSCKFWLPELVKFKKLPEKFIHIAHSTHNGKSNCFTGRKCDTLQKMLFSHFFVLFLIKISNHS